MKEAVFIRRVTRFTCEVQLEGKTVPVHLANTGRLLFLREGETCLLRPAASPARRTAWDLYAAMDRGVPVCVDSIEPNRAAYLVLEKELAASHPGAVLEREVTLGDSRLDLLARLPDRLLAVEVKGSTMVRSGISYFPDAPSTRAVKHVHHLRELAEAGHDARILFIVCREDAEAFSPEKDIDPAFTEALAEAVRSGVRVNALLCRCTWPGLEPVRFLPVLMPGHETTPSN